MNLFKPAEQGCSEGLIELSTAVAMHHKETKMLNLELAQTLIEQVKAGKVDSALVSAMIANAPTAQVRGSRLIEEAIYQAIAGGKPLRRSRYGTVTHQVTAERGSDHRTIRRVYLYGSLIAVVVGGLVVANSEIFEQWPTVTTASRLRSLGLVANIHKGKAKLGTPTVYNSDFA